MNTNPQNRITSGAREAYKRVCHVFKRTAYIIKKHGIKNAVKVFDYDTKKAGVRRNGAISTAVKRTVPVFVSIAVIFAAVNLWTTYTMALEVKYNGKTIGYVENEQVFDKACEIISDRLIDDEFTAQPLFIKKMVTSDAVDDVNSICDNLISATNEYADGCGLYVDGALAFVCHDEATLKSALDNAFEIYRAGNSEIEVSCSNKLEYVNGLYSLDGYYTNTLTGEQLAQKLVICNVTTEVYTQIVPYATVKVSDSSKYIGYEQVATAGADGEKMITQKIYYKNGVEQKREKVAEEIIVAAVDEKIVIGTKALTAPAKANGTSGGNAVYFWPVERVSPSYITAYYGDGRNHKGIDICAPAGSAIYAGEAGTVTAVETSSDYGNYIKIDHGNGYSTLYSHCSTMSVSVGQKVIRGQYIAGVGMTGRATGNHLHFEVRINDSPVNPASYLGVG